MLRLVSSLLVCLTLTAYSFAGESAQLDSGLTAYIHVRTSATTTVHIAFPETIVSSGSYAITDAQLVTGGLTGDCRDSIFQRGYPYVITTSSTSSASPLWGGEIDWDGDSTRPLASQASVDDLDPSTTLPINQTYVGDATTWVLQRTRTTCSGDRTIAMHVGESLPFAIDCRKVMAINANLTDFDSVGILTGTSGGVTFGDPGFDKAVGKVVMTAVTAGTYVIRGTLSSDDSDGNATIKGDVTLLIVL